MASMTVTAGKNLGVELRDHARTTGALIFSRTRHHTGLLQTKTKSNASTGDHAPGAGHIPGTGPGPNVGSGDYRRSIEAEVEAFSNGDAARGIVGSNADQARRLELGFVGVDSLGRLYDQQPFPHYGPALDHQGPLFIQDIVKIANSF